MTSDWKPLEDELALWRVQGLTLPLWWRDDDATVQTPQLETLTALSERVGLPVHLAVIPRDANASLAGFVARHESLIPVVHGWAHQNHAPAGEKKSEFRAHRPLQDITADVQAGLNRLTDLFDERLLPMFVPPWNRIGDEAVAQLPALGFRILSTATPRKATFAVPGLEQINTHLDPIDWRGTRGLVAPDILIARMAALLQDRRTGQTDNTEPFGILTHHLVHDPDIWTFTEALLTKLLEGPTHPWVAFETPERSSPK
ncbi:MAG: polysaccharide deacetylase family protein [Pseudomonadota bacterium]